MNLTALLAAALSFAVLFYGSSCTPPNPDDLDKLGFADLTIKDRPFHLWLADSYSEQANGLMFVTAERMAPLSDGTQRGMIFVFDHEQELNFWMKNTIIPLDIAYLDSEGVVVNKYTMAPLDERPNQYPSGKPARFAIEVGAGVFTDLKLAPGDRITIPDSVLKRSR
ncbi:MAG: DUF192 domain-containing protein [Phycisphaerales bacterium]|nr:DUF192 domain-containing protein [Phycisphaerales bacterium]